ncbi:HD family phosphohydrolase [Dethiosulfovibrio salsuginis]|uniref:HD/PDEase domain-containing protein n=1 Tax=Dethiosulfovibrio salsuginis TaxID=561720 RepID=A0A1X7KTB1_9BACT|nr:HDIG domain-containing metalloprotein [Dethiosulfovibrio salsuginis]SMG44789.1 hypothetical protein SAMN06275492_13614 [Dethiosulfovibrio salsuginis]
MSGTIEELLKVAYISLSALLVVCCLFVALRWTTIDIRRSFIPGFPAYRTYFALFNMKYEDEGGTEKLQDLVRDGIAGVMVRRTGQARDVEERLSLIGEGRLDEAGISPAISEIIRNLPEERSKVLFEAISSAGLSLLTFSPYRDSFSGVNEDLLWNRLSPYDLPPGDGNLAVQIMSDIMVPLVGADDGMTDRLRSIVAETIGGVPRELNTGDIIVTKGSIITPQIADLLRKQGYPQGNFPIRSMMVVFLLVPPVFLWARRNVILGWDSRKSGYLAFLFFIGIMTSYLSSLRDLTSLGVVSMAGMAYVTLPLRRARNSVMAGKGIVSLVFGGLGPLALGEIMSVGVMASALGDLLFKKIDSRSRLWLGMVQMGLVLGGVSLIVRWFFSGDSGILLTAQTFLGAILIGSVTMLLLPVAEVLFDILSPLRLLELCQPDHPLQKRLQIEAPGTYHHSQMVSILAEGAADALGLNSRLVKAGGFFHDIGKLKRPHFFIENQFGAKNAHDDLSPVMSSLVIISHVRDGLDLAEEYRLPERISHFIAEHHGTTFMGYFYKKAKKEGLDPSESQFTYPGPRPRSRETGLVMLADSIEAAVRAERENIKSVIDLQQIVNSVTASKVNAGQLDDTGFTLRDLAVIRSAMIQNLKSMYHTRNIAPIGDNNTAKSGKEGNR